MIRSLRIRNFKCLRDVTVELDGLTVLIGKNDTGKTSLLEAVSLLGALTRGERDLFQGSSSVPALLSGDATNGRIEWEVTIGATEHNGLPGDATYELAISPGEGEGPCVVEHERLKIAGTDSGIERVPHEATGSSVVAVDGGVRRSALTGARSYTALSVARKDQGLPTLQAVARALTSTIKYQLDTSQLARPSELETESGAIDYVPHLRLDGFGLASVLDYLLGTNRRAFNTIEERLRAGAPFVREIVIRPRPVETREGETMGKALFFRLNEGTADVPAGLMSDGVLLLLAYLTLVHGAQPGVLLIEEPENGIHPRQLARVVKILQNLADDPKAGTQVLAATHSPYVLDLVSPGSVRVFGRRTDGHTVVAPLRSLPGVQERLDGGMTLGEMWFNTGEDRLLEDLLCAPAAGE